MNQSGRHRRVSRTVALALAGALLCAVGLVSTVAIASSRDSVVRISTNDSSVRSRAGNTYVADSRFVGGHRVTFAGRNREIRNTDDDALFRTERYGMSAYNIPLPAGRYQVRLMLAENWWNAPGVRVFSVTAEGREFARDIDIFAAVGRDAEYDVSRDVTVTDGTLNLDFQATRDYAKVSAIRIARIGDPPAPVPTAPSASPTPSPSTTPTATASSTGPTSAPSSPVPTHSPTRGPTGGPAGDWTAAFTDEFEGTAVDTTKWSTMEGWTTNKVTTHASNLAVGNGVLTLTLASSTSGAEVCTNPSGAGAQYLFPVGSYAEARVYFPGNGSTIYNWPAWWTSGPNWPAAGENDIAEGLGTMTANYHSPSGAHNQGTIPGTWSNGFHVYGVHRMAHRSDVYYDGVKVKSYPTDDNGVGQSLIINIGEGNQHVYGAASQIKVDWVRAWAPR